jgi:hypothetical protein
MKIKEKFIITDDEIKFMRLTAMCIWRGYDIFCINLGTKPALTEYIE